MSAPVPVFFYGLFMDAELLRGAGASPVNPRPAQIRGWSLRIGNRATLVPASNATVHGIVMDLTHDELDRLYAVESLRSYRPYPVICESPGGQFAALCFNLVVPPQPSERNDDYARKLHALAIRLQLPADYVATIYKPV